MVLPILHNWKVGHECSVRSRLHVSRLQYSCFLGHVSYVASMLWKMWTNVVSIVISASWHISKFIRYKTDFATHVLHNKIYNNISHVFVDKVMEFQDRCCSCIKYRILFLFFHINNRPHGSVIFPAAALIQIYRYIDLLWIAGDRASHSLAIRCWHILPQIIVEYQICCYTLLSFSVTASASTWTKMSEPEVPVDMY